MKTLDDELKKLGFSDDLVSAVNKSEYLDVQGIKVEEFHFQDYENGIITSTQYLEFIPNLDNPKWTKLAAAEDSIMSIPTTIVISDSHKNVYNLNYVIKYYSCNTIEVPVTANSNTTIVDLKDEMKSHGFDNLEYNTLVRKGLNFLVSWFGTSPFLNKLEGDTPNLFIGYYKKPDAGLYYDPSEMYIILQELVYPGLTTIDSHTALEIKVVPKITIPE